jgi:glutamate racemase
MKYRLRERQAFDHRLHTAMLALLMLFLIPAPAGAQERSEPEWLPALLEQESITIVVTDSGLGGLSVVADAVEKFRQQRVFKQVDIIFFNALFRDQGGYNSLHPREEKIRVFNRALESMRDRYDPDIILVACNTLSVLVPDTEFARSAAVPVVGIVDNGVAQIAQYLRDQPVAKNIIFATQTTVDEGTHKNLLLGQGIENEQVVTQACPQLTQYIEQGYDSPYTEMLIDAYVDEALTGMEQHSGPLTVSFNCTHFGYSLEFWKQAFASRGVEVTAFLDPNMQMTDFLLPAALQGRYPQSEVTVKAVSMIDIPPVSQDSIGRYLHAVSPATEAALRNFELNPELFEWREPLAGEER